MTLADGTTLSPALGIGAFAEKTLVAAGPVHQGRPVGERRRRRPARLRRHGRARCCHQHRRRRAAATRSRSSAAAASATRPSPARCWPVRARSSPWTSTTESSSGRSEFGATHTVNSRADRPGRGHQGDHRVRRRRDHRRRRPARGLPAGVGRPRPGRHHRPRRRPEPDDGVVDAAHRDLRPRRLDQVLVVRRLPALPRLPDARRPAPAGTAAPRQVRLARPSPSTRSRRRSTRWSAARSCVPSSLF